jgi:two-component sensor histidine kinase
VGWLGRLDVPARYRNWAPQWLASVLIGLAFAAAAMLVREGLQLLWPTVVPFGIVFPAILLATLLGRWQAGLTTFIASGILVATYVLPPLADRLGMASTIPMLFLYSFTGIVMLGTAEAYRQAERRLHNERALRAEADATRQRLLAHELNHRIKNTLAIVQAIAAQTLGRGGVKPEVCNAFEERLAALARAHDLLTTAVWSKVPLDELGHGATAAFDDGGRFRIDGPFVELSPRQAVAISLALHELCTNALKYGALSAPDGRVDIGWAVADGELRLAWTEHGGPMVSKPSTCGFGTRLLERGLAAELKGSVALTFATTGVHCDIRAPLDGAAPPCDPLPSMD